ncbi:hypothetical protein [Peribacillus sp. NPDC058002]|uniref:hypothetical protein n=1 Tax=Peribacillus sp. NPDC058002 TaxID=3346301 RepID=UPI0036DBBD11
MIRLTKKPQKKVYTDLINLAFDTCDRFHLVIRKDMGPLDMFKDFLKQLDSSLIEVKEESEWASNILLMVKKRLFTIIIQIPLLKPLYWMRQTPYMTGYILNYQRIYHFSKTEKNGWQRIAMNRNAIF